MLEPVAALNWPSCLMNELPTRPTIWTRNSTHLSKNKIESNLSVPGIQEDQENALIKSFEMSPHLIGL